MSATQTNQETAIIERNLLSLRERVEGITVVSQSDYVAACNMVVEGRGFIKRWTNVFKPQIDSAREHLDLLRNELKSHTVGVEEIVAIAERKAEAWKAEERRLAQIEQDRINAEEKRRRDEQVEAQRIENERIAAETKKTRVAEIRAQLKFGTISKRTAERLLREAGATEEAALAAASAAADEAKAAPPPAVKVEPAVPKVAGIKGRVNYKFEVVNGSLLPREYLQPDLVKIGELVRRTKNSKRAMALIPGIRCFEEDSI
jgi:hypothetical protein